MFALRHPNDEVGFDLRSTVGQSVQLARPDFQIEAAPTPTQQTQKALIQAIQPVKFKAIPLADPPNPQVRPAPRAGEEGASPGRDSRRGQRTATTATVGRKAPAGKRNPRTAREVDEANAR